jgi:hypothetical protein
MSQLTNALVVFTGVFASGLLGIFLRHVLPERHLQEDSIGMVRLGAGVIATLSALVLGLLVASAKANYDRVNDEVTHAAAAIVLLDRTLAEYGPQTKEVRSSLRAVVASTVDSVFSDHGHGVAALDDRQRLASGERLRAELRELTPETNMQRMLQADALELSNEVTKTRMLVVTQTAGPIPPVFLAILVFWFGIMFAGFGLLSSKNPTVIVILFVCALSLAGAVLMIEGLNRPLDGPMRISSTPMRYALSHLGG